MQPGDRFRFLRGLGLAVAALLLVSGAVLASSAGRGGSDDTLDRTGASADASASAEASAAPRVSFQHWPRCSATHRPARTSLTD